MDSKQTQLSGSSSRGTMGGHDGRSADEIARNIAARRAEMSALADTLEERLAPKQLASEVSHAVKKQLQGRTHRAASAMASSVRQDPFPWVLMGLGAAWLIKERRERANATRFGAVKRGIGDSGVLGVSSYGSMGYASSYGTAHPMESPTEPVSGLSDSGLTGSSYEEHGGVAEGMAEKAHEVREKVADKTHEVREKVADKAHAAKERVAETAHEVREKVSSTVSAAGEKAHLAKQRAAEKARQAKMGLSRQYDSNPLLLGLAALVGGVVLGSALPATRKEEEVLGPVRDRLFEQVRDTGRDVAGKVSRVAEVAVHTAVDQIERDGSTQDLGRLASSAAHAASEAAKREASRQGLASGSLGESDGVSSGTSTSRSGGDGFSRGGARTAGAGGGAAMAPSTSVSPTVPGGSGGGPLVPPTAGSPALSGSFGSPGSSMGGQVERARESRAGDPDRRGYDPERDPRES